MTYVADLERGSRAPDFVIVGAPKCGTTALSQYLREHPGVFFSTPKEPLYFCEDFSGLLRPQTMAEYLALFQHAPADALAGEASAMYLYSGVAIANLHRALPRARLIAMVRNPVDLAHAFHSEMVYSQNEDETDFLRAWDLQSERQVGRRIPRLCWEPRFLQYREVARVGSQLQRLLEIVPAEQVLILLFDDFVRDTAAVYERALSFLDLPSEGRQEFPVVNENKRLRRPWLARVTQRPPRLLSRLLATGKRALGLEHVHVLGAIRRANLQRSPRPGLPPKVREHLADEFASEIALVSRLLGRDLTSWQDRPSRA